MIKTNDYSLQIAHAMGPVDGELYTNSLDAFERNYANGFRVFEVDVVRLADGNYVAAHDGLESRYGCDSFSSISIEDFPKYFLGYRTLTFPDLLHILDTYPDVKFVLDNKGGNNDLYDLCLGYSDRVIPQLSTKEHLEKYSSLFEHFILAYWGYKGTAEDLVVDCLEHSVRHISLNKKFKGGEIHAAIKELGPQIIWHEEIYAQEVVDFLHAGDAVMSDCHFISNFQDVSNTVADMQFAVRTVGISYMRNLGRRPDVNGLQHYTQMLMRRQVDVQELNILLQESQEGKQYRAGLKDEPAEANFIDSDLFYKLVQSFYEVFYNRRADFKILKYANSLLSGVDPIRGFFEACDRSGEFRTRLPYIPISGQYDAEGEFCWYGKTATFVVKDVPIYASIPKDFPFEQRLILSNGHERKTVSLRPGEAVKIRNHTKRDAEVWTVAAQQEYRPSLKGSPDMRALAFQLSSGTRELTVVREEKYHGTNFPLVAVSGSLKEERVLRILMRELEKLNIECLFFAESSVEFRDYIKGRGDGIIFMVASADTFFLCERLIDKAKYIYIEHGIAPFKGYTYGAHYKNYDHVLLPSNFWAKRIEELHGEMSSYEVVGYPVISSVNLQKEKEIDVLIAPTWSRNSLHLRHVQDVVLAGLHGGLRIAYAGHPDSIACIEADVLEKLIPVTNIYEALGKTNAVLTDFSSLGIEAAVLNIPVLLVETRALDDFDRTYYDEGKIEVPYSNGMIWDIGPVVNAGNFVESYKKLISVGARAQSKLKKWSAYCHSVAFGDAPVLAALSVRNYLRKERIDE